ncbi:MAG: aspartate/glutamate racemase family protein [bacterium]
MAEKVIGVLGGLGPWATLDLFEKILTLTPAGKDQDHLRLIIDNNPKIPDRSPAIFGTGEDPTPALVETARNLERAGADFIVIPCNTAHFFYDAVRRAVSVPVLHIMNEVAASAGDAVPGLRKVGVLATAATVRSRLYHDAFERLGVTVVGPDEQGQDAVNRAIYGVKAGRMGPEVTRELVAVAAALVSEDAQAIVLGCTELPFVLREQDLTVPLLDSNLILASAAIRLARDPGSLMASAAPSRMP